MRATGSILVLALALMAADAARLRNGADGDAGSKSAKKKGKHCKTRLDPFDCYSGEGEDYVGLADMALSGRRCKNWLEQGDFGPTEKGIGNHNFCRNPEPGKKDKPWCFTVDPEKEWEYCQVPQCKEKGPDPEAWVAPEGSKSEEAEAEGPCEYVPPKKKGYKEAFGEEGHACTDRKGDTQWLIGNKKYDVADEGECVEQCHKLPGSEYFTFFGIKDDDGNNCGCYRDCIYVPKDLTIHDPNSFRIE